MINEISGALANFLNITFRTDAIWIIIPLAISTFLMMIYFGIYREEKADWNTNFSNSLVLVFVSIALFRYIYGINNAGEFNFVNEWERTLLTIGLLSIGLFSVRFNFEHLLPINIARYTNSPITVNLLAYAVILLVYTTEKISLASVLTLLLIVLFLMGILILIKIPGAKLRNYMEKEKRKERLTNLKEEMFEIKELKKQLQIIQIDEQGEKAFLYGSNIEMERITSDSSSLKKHQLIFVHNQQGIYLGLGLLRVQQARSENIKNRARTKSDDFSRSNNFILSILNLTDAGHYLRDGR